MTNPDSLKDRIEDDELLSSTPVKLQHEVFFSVAASSRLNPLFSGLNNQVQYPLRLRQYYFPTH
jgi:hypothetical protein